MQVLEFWFILIGFSNLRFFFYYEFEIGQVFKFIKTTVRNPDVRNYDVITVNKKNRLKYSKPLRFKFYRSFLSLEPLLLLQISKWDLIFHYLSEIMKSKLFYIQEKMPMVPIFRRENLKEKSGQNDILLHL